jgi:thiosulfate dehydrogenase
VGSSPEQYAQYVHDAGRGQLMRRLVKPALIALALLGGFALFGVGGWGIADTASVATTDDLPTLDTLETRPNMQRPVLTLPNDLVTAPRILPGEFHVPPRLPDIPDSKYGEMVSYGREIFIHTQTAARRYVGNGLNCASCHLQEGRKPYAAPMWAAYPLYPMYRESTKQVVTFQNQIQSCFRNGLNGIAPALDTPDMKALTVYAHWLSSDVPTDTLMAGRGFARIDKSEDPSAFGGETLYKQQCMLCHGADLHGKKFADRPGYMFPPLAGSDSYSEGSGMNKVKTCASFVKANMPLGKPFSLNDDQALQVCVHIFLQERPWNSRKSWFSSLFLRPLGGG